MFVSGDEYSHLVSKLVSEPSSVDIAVAFLGAGAESLLSKVSAGRLICNLESGATNPAVVKKILDNQSFEVRSLSNLHAKVILSEKNVLCGSANISANGLGLERSEVARWCEAGIFSTDSSVVAATCTWFNDLWEKAHTISDDDLGAAEINWKKRRNARPFPTGKDLFSHILANPEFAIDRPIYLAVYRESASVEAEKAFIDWTTHKECDDGEGLDFYEDWPELPNNAYLVDIYYGPRGGVRSGGLFWTGPERKTKKFKSRESELSEIRMVFKQSSYDDLRVVNSELDNFVRIVKPIVQDMWLKNSVEEGGSAFCVPLEFVMAAVSLGETDAKEEYKA